jgi:uncharacterized damage-inducible protein DinB
MEILVGLENGYEGRTLAWALEHPGCFAYGRDRAEALENIAAEFIRYKDWIAAHTPDSWLAGADQPLVRLSEVWEVYLLDSDYRRVESGGKTVNAWFSSDWLPLTRLDIERGMQLLRFSRKDLLEAVGGISTEELDRERPGERWSLRGILGHIASAEWWYLERLDLAGIPREQLPEDVFARLEVVRSRLVEVLPQLEGAERVRGKMGEWWSPRKVLRRAVEHELDHIGHIRKLLGQ